MKTYLLGYGPILNRTYTIFENVEMNPVVVSNRGRLTGREKVISYSDFIRSEIRTGDLLIVGWRSLTFSDRIEEVDNVIEFLNQNIYKFKNIVYLSSGAVYGNGRIDFNENHSPNPFNQYGREKLEIEHWLVQMNLRKCVILRISNVFGDLGFPDLINGIVNSWKKTTDLSLFLPTRFFRNYVSINFVSEVIFSLASGVAVDLEGINFVNVSDSRARSTQEILSIFQEISPRSVAVESIPIPELVPFYHSLSNEKLTNFCNWKYSDSTNEIVHYLQCVLNPSNYRMR